LVAVPAGGAEALPMSGHETGGRVEAVHSDTTHGVYKATRPSITLLAGIGVEGDVHAGATVRHRSRVERGPEKPNLRQVHLIHCELHDELREAGFAVNAGDMGENVTTSGLDLLGLPTDTLLHLGSAAVVRVTGVRNPCKQLNEIQDGLMSAVLDRDAEGNLVRKSGIMTVVVAGGEVRAGDTITVELPPTPHEPLKPV
jgi:MOSC domain-containing protein YiiM